MLFKFLIILFGFLNFTWADNVIDNPTLLYSATDNNALNQTITINRTFNNINDLTQRINLIDGLSAQVKGLSATKPITVNVNLINSTIKDLLNKTAFKLGYNWTLNNSVIYFTPINPLPLKIKVNSSAIIPVIKALAPNTVVIKQPIWILDPKDHTLRNALIKWCKAGGWQLVWNVKEDYPIVVGVSIPGTFEHAVNEVLKASQATDKPLLATMHDGSKVLEIYSTSDK